MLESDRQHIQRATHAVSEHAVDEAFRRGIQRAASERNLPMVLSQLGKKRRLRLITAILSIVLLCGASLIGSHMLDQNRTVQLEEVHHLFPSYIEEKYHAKDNFLLMLKQGAARGLYHELNQSVTSGGYTLTIDGIVADSRRIIMFYTAKNGNADLPLRLSYNQLPQLLDQQGQLLNGTFTWDSYITLSKNQPFTKGLMIFDFEKPGQMPQKLQIQTTWSQLRPEGNTMPVQTETLVVPVTLQPSKHATDMEERPIQVTILDKGEQITFTRMIQSPLRTDLVFDHTSSNGKRLDKMETVLELASREKQAKQRLEFDTRLGYDRVLFTPQGGTIYLPSTLYSEHQELWLKFYQASFEPDQAAKIIVDPKQASLLQTSDADIRFMAVPGSSETEELKFRLLYGQQEPIRNAQTNEIVEWSPGGYFELEDTFTDGDGQRHPFTQQYESRLGTLIRIPNYKHYPAPFSFTITKYWGNVLEMNEAAEQRIR